MFTDQGFTLIELLIVITIIGLLTAVLLPSLLSARIKSEDAAVRAYIRQCTTALESTRQLPALKITTSIADCQDSKLPPVTPRPPYILSDQITVNPDGDTYLIKVVNKRGRTFEYNGGTLKEY